LTDLERERRGWVGVAAPVDVGVIEPGETDRGDSEGGEITPYFQDQSDSPQRGAHSVHKAPDGVDCVDTHRGRPGVRLGQLLGHNLLDCILVRWLLGHRQDQHNLDEWLVEEDMVLGSLAVGRIDLKRDKIVLKY